MPKTQDSWKSCDFCGVDLTAQELDDPDLNYREVHSWVTGRKSQSPVLRQQTGRLAHVACVKKLIDGEAPDQQAIPGLET